MVLRTYLALNSFEYFMWVVQGSISFVPCCLACRRRDFRVKFRVLKGFMSVFRSAQEPQGLPTHEKALDSRYPGDTVDGQNPALPIIRNIP